MYVCSSVEGKIVCSMVCVYVYQSLLLSKNKGKLYFLGGEIYIFIFIYSVLFFYHFFSTTTNRRRKNLSSTETFESANSSSSSSRARVVLCVCGKDENYGMRIKTIKQCVYTVEQNSSKDSFFLIFFLFLFSGGFACRRCQKIQLLLLLLCFVPEPVSVWIREKKYIYL